MRARRLLDFSVFDKDLDHVGEEAIGFLRHTQTEV